MKKCPKCHREYDDSWGVCFTDNEKLILLANGETPPIVKEEKLHSVGGWRGKMKTCPFCAKEIQDDAIKCKYCRKFLEMPQGSIECPFCHNLIEPISKSVTFGDFIVCLLLCLLWVIPGVVYIILKVKNAGKECPKCKMKIG